MKRKSKLLSTCCGAPTTFSEIVPDFIGDKQPKIGTAYCICTKCKQPCNVYSKERRTWAINPKTRVIPNKKKRITKLSPRDLKRIKQEEDF
jgi:hypothetical protein